MNRRLIYILFILSTLTGCITNDLPYPEVVPNITSVVAEGTENVEIDYADRTVTLFFPETVDLRKVRISSVEIDQEIAATSVNLVGIHDLTSPLKVTIRTYSDYDWTIMAERNVLRYFTIKDQVGSTVIDPANCRAVAMIGKNSDVSDVTVTSLKLGPEGLTEYSMPIEAMKDFTHGISIDVKAFDAVEVWSLYVEKSETSVEINKVNPWANKVYLTASGVAGQNNGFRYRMSGSDVWTDVPESEITEEGGSFTSVVSGLQPGTPYEVVAFSGDEVSEVAEFTTEYATPIPNGSFEYATKVAGKDYYKFYDPDCGVEEGMYMFWGSGNGEGPEGINGSANLGIVITYIDTAEKVDGKQSVRAQTSQMVGMLAAGNLFTGQFAGLVGTSGGKVNFGRPWNTRPVALRIYCKYVTGKMDIINGMPPGVNLSKEDYDCAEIKFAIGQWDHKQYGGTQESPVHINTTDPRTFVDFNTDRSTIANGSLVIHHDGYVLDNAAKVDAETDKWIEYIIPLNYHSMDALPTHLIISCASSRYGDYFTGCSHSALWIDAAELIY